ncbi:hypothetical protein QYE76_012049 [Lolium multiflorum]|uniref:Uncharacterized protein n=1 Tax=Lolium multiflorum TaxID=4521 RepID=A0AAD8U090_LOLMU|nr:hypothetical protein QYE76_012049 [Lolium multiflorum]
MEGDRGDQKPLELAIKRIVSAKLLVKPRDNNGGSLLRLFLASSVSGAIHYGWGMQISILTPYAQLLGVPHMFASLICSSGPLAGVLVNPTLNYHSDRCTMRMGRRRPFILVGCLLLSISAMVIGYSPDIGHYLGDPKIKCGVFSVRKGASAMVIFGFWLLDFANNTVRGVTRAMMDDLSVGNKHGPQIGYVLFCFWGSVGVTLGLAAGATGKWPGWFPWLKTEACCHVCANIKGSCIASVVYIVITMALTMAFADEQPIEKKDVDTSHVQSFSNPFKCLKNMSPSTTQLFILTGLSWLALYPFFIYNTDWMGREIYHGNPRGSREELHMYTNGFRQGCIGLILSVIARTVTTAFIPKLCHKLTARTVWALSNFLMCLLMLTAVIISVLSSNGYRPSSRHSRTEPDPTLVAIALGIFALLGISGSITQCVPMALAFHIAATEGGDSQGNAVGAISIAIVMPQVLAVLTTGPIDNACGDGGNTPGFALSAALAFLSWFLGLLLLSRKSDISYSMPLL